MFDIASPELLLVAIVAIVVIGPKDLPKAMRVVGYWVGKARGTMRQFRSGFEAMVREAELAEMEKKWAEENKRIMAEHPAGDAEELALPASENASAPAAVMTEKPVTHGETDASISEPSENNRP